MSLASVRKKLIALLRATLIVLVFFGVVIAVAIGGIKIQSRLPIHPVHTHCYQSRVWFEGPKTERFIAFYIKLIEQKDQPYSIRNGVIYTTGYASGDNNMDKFIEQNIRPEWFSDDPKFDTSEQKAIVERWREAGRDQWGGKEWCHVVEAAIAKDGIDAEARRDHPDIWPPYAYKVPAGN